ncbi:MAG TPA: DUF1569 domain-containing protein [Terracidiphilus sp.]|jgi:hypothetical protein
MKTLSDPEGRREILRRLALICPDTPHRWGRMNASQMICHVSDAFLGVMGDKPIEMPRGFNLWPMMKPWVLYAPFNWPQGVPTRPEMDQQIGGTRPVEFDQDMRRLLAAIERFTAQPRTFRFRPHPMFKEMSEKDWMRWGYLHTAHHLRQFGV